MDDKKKTKDVTKTSEDEGNKIPKVPIKIAGKDIASDDVNKKEKVKDNDNKEMSPPDTKSEAKDSKNNYTKEGKLSDDNAQMDDKHKLAAAVERLSEAKKKTIQAVKQTDAEKARERVITSTTNAAAEAKENLTTSSVDNVSDQQLTETAINNVTKQISTDSNVLESIKRLLQQKHTYNIQQLDDTNQFDLTFNSARNLLSAPVQNKIVNGPPRLLRMKKVDGDNSKLLLSQYYDKHYGNEQAPFIKRTLELFSPGTSVIKIKLESENTTISVTHDPDVPLTGTKSFIDPIRVTGAGSEHRMNSATTIHSIIDQVIRFILQIVPSCRVKIAGMKFRQLDHSIVRRGLINFILPFKLPDDISEHIIFNIGHPIQWFEDKITEMVDQAPSQYLLGETMVDSYMMGYGKRRRNANLPSDQYAADLYAIHYHRTIDSKLTIGEYLAYLDIFAGQGMVMTVKDNCLTDDDYEIMGVRQHHIDSFMALYIISNSYKNGITTLMQEHALSMNIVRTRSLTEIISDMMSKGLPTSSQKHTAYLQQNYRALSKDSFINLMLMDMLSAFYNVRIKPRPSRVDTDLAMFDLLSNLLLCCVFPSIVRQNLQILGYNICSILMSIQFDEMITFLSSVGFCDGHNTPKILTDDEYFTEKKLPRIFDNSIPIKEYKTLSMIRKLIKPIGETEFINVTNGVCYPTFDGMRQVYIPWKLTERQEAYAVNDMQLKVKECLLIVNKVMVRYNNKNVKSKADMSATVAVLNTMQNYMDEFCQALHHEIRDLYVIMAKHYGYLFDNFKSPINITRPSDMRFGVISTEKDQMSRTLPWAPFKETFTVDWKVGLSMFLTNYGLLRPLTDKTGENPAVVYRDPVKDYMMFDSLVKSAAEIMEPVGILRNILHNDYDDSVTNLIRHTISKTGMRENIVTLMKELFKERNVPDDVLSFVKDQLAYSNRLIMTKIKVVQVDRMNNVMVNQPIDTPVICDRVLDVEDPFLKREIEVASKMVFSSSSLLLKFGRGIEIKRCYYTHLSPRNVPTRYSCDWQHFTIMKERAELLSISFVDGRKKVGYLDQETGKFYDDFDSCEFPKIHFTAPNAEYVSPKYREQIIYLLKRGTWALTFTDIFFQATVVYNSFIPDKLHEDMMRVILDTPADGVAPLIFPDTTCEVNTIYDEARTSNDAQYIYTNVDLERDVIAKSIIGHNGPKLNYQELNPLNWQSGKDTRGGVSMFLNGMRKVSSGVPNFNNSFMIDNEKAYIRTLPEVEVVAPTNYFDSR